LIIVTGSVNFTFADTCPAIINRDGHYVEIRFLYFGRLVRAKYHSYFRDKEPILSIEIYPRFILSGTPRRGLVETICYGVSGYIDGLDAPHPIKDPIGFIHIVQSTTENLLESIEADEKRRESNE
jgi:hypothetical protein